MNTSTSSRKETLRKSLRAARRALTKNQQRLASRSLLKQFYRSKWRFRTKSIAVYLPFGGEISPEELLRWAQKSHVACYLPTLHPIYKHRLAFCRYDQFSTMKNNRFGISEPCFARSAKVNPRFISVVFTPLVGFDNNANRLGMGGGFYDRTFQFKRQWRQFAETPLQIGLAHDCQKADHIPVEKWDLPLDGVISDQETIYVD